MLLLKDCFKMVTQKEIKKVLSEIIDPELGADIVSLGFIKDIKIEGGKVTVKIRLTTAGCPLAMFFIREIEEKIQKLQGVSKAEVILV